LSVINICPLATWTFFGVIGTGVRPTSCRKEEFTKLWELPLSSKISFTLFFTLALSFKTSPLAVPEIALIYNCCKSSVTTSSMANWFRMSLDNSVSKVLTTIAWTYACGLLVQLAAWATLYLSPQ
jgi:hypothetical protein